MSSGPLFGTLASRALDRQEPCATRRSASRRPATLGFALAGILLALGFLAGAALA